MTGIVVTYNTYGLFKQMYESLRVWMPDLPLVVVDGSSTGDPCQRFVKEITGGRTTCYQLGRNIGHGRGLHYAIERVQDEQLLLMDSDITIHGNPLEQMAGLLTRGVWGVGEIDMVGVDGLRRNPLRDVPFIQPYFMMLSRMEYYKYHRFVHHGTPSYKAMVEIKRQGLSAAALAPFAVDEYVYHHWGGTRAVNKAQGLHEIPDTWER